MIFDIQRFVIYGTAGRDTIRNSQSANAIYAYSGNDSIYNNYSAATIYAGDGNDTVQNQSMGYRSYIAGGNGSDYIYGFFVNSTLDGGAGNDTFYLRQGDGYGSYTTIIGGTGNDTIRADGGNQRVYFYEEGDGDDVIYSARSRDTLYIGDGTYTTARSGNDFVVSVGKGSVTFKNISSMNIVGGEEEDEPSTVGVNLRNTKSNVSLTGAAGNDTIYNSGKYVTITAGDGDDSIYSSNNSYNGAFVTINAGSGNDTITGRFGGSSVSAGAGNDRISMSGDVDLATINPGAGNDTVYMDNYDGFNVYQYSAGDGNDVIYYLSSNDTLHVVSGSISGSSVSGSDVILSAGTGSLTLKNALNQYVWLKTGTGAAVRTKFKSPDEGVYLTNFTSYVSLTGATSDNDTIYNTGSYVTIDAGGGDDRIYNVQNNYSYINAGEGDDYISLLSGGVTVSAGAGDDTVYANSNAYRGVLLLYENGDGNDIIYGASSYTTLDLADNSYTTTKSGNDLIVSVEGGALTFKNTSSVKILDPNSGVYISNTKSNTVISATSNADTIYNSGKYVRITTGSGDDSIYNYATTRNSRYITVDAGAGNDTISGRYGSSSISAGAGNDVIDLSEGDVDGATINGGEGNDLIYNDDYDGYNVFQYKTGDGNDTIIGFTKNDTLKITGSYTTVWSGDDLIYNVGTGSIILKDYVPSGENIFNSTKNKNVSGTNYNDTIENAAGGAKIYAGAGDDSIYNSVNNEYTINGSYGYVTIDGGAGNDTIYSDDPYVSISGGADADTISLYGSWKGITVNGGTGDDAVYAEDSDGILYQYKTGDGKDTIYGFTSFDTLKITGSYTTVKSGDDLIYNVGTGSVRLKDYAPVSGIITNSKSDTIITGTDANDTVYNSGRRVTISTGAGNDSIHHDYDEFYGSYVTIDAGAGNDTITGVLGDSSIYGGAGNDVIDISEGDVDYATINGGTGDDLIYNDDYDGYNVFQYKTGDGNDTIIGFTKNDTLKITGSYTTVKSGDDLIYNVGAGSVRLKDYAPSGVNIINSTSHRTITGTSYNDTIRNIYDGGGDYVSISAGAGNDTIYNDYGWYITIDAGAGNDTVTSYLGVSNSINAGDGNDVISLRFNEGSSTIRAGKGNDTIYGDTVESYGVIYQYFSGDGDDVIYNFHSNDTITGATYTSAKSGSNIVLSMNGGGKVTLVGASAAPANIFTEGNDSYTNTTAATVLNALAGNDTIVNNANRVTINAGEGADRVTNTGISIAAYGGDGDDSFYNDNGDYAYVELGAGNDSFYADNNDNVRVYGGDGSDTIKGSFYTSIIYGGAGADFVSVPHGMNTIDGGDGNDTLIASGGSISGGAGNDRISLSGSSPYTRIVKGGTGNDTLYGIKNGASVPGIRYEYAYGDGSDIIYNYSSYDTVSIAGASQYSRVTVGSNVLLNVMGSGVITLSGAKNSTVNVVGGSLVADTGTGVEITNSTSGRTLTGTYYNDTISNVYSSGGDSVLIDAGDGDDEISNDWGYEVTIDAGAGDDTITVTKASSNSVNAGAGDDLISISASQGLVVIRGGEGNDTIYGDSTAHVYQYANGDGEDILYGYNARDTVTITGGDWTSATVGNDVIISISDSNSTVETGAITLSGAKGKAINVYGETAEETDTGTGTSTVPSGSQQQVIQTFMGVLDTVNSDGINRLNQAVSVASGGYFANMNAAINQMVDDCRNASSANDFLLNYCGINLSNADTGAITGADAGGSATKTASSVVPESGSVNSFTGSSFTTNGLTVQLASVNYWGDPTAISYSALTTDRQRYVWQALQTWWAQAALNLNAQSYGSNYGFGANSSATVNKLYFGFERENSGTMATTYFNTNSSGNVDELAMTVNMSNYDSLIIGNSDGRNSGSDDYYLDRVLSHEFTHAVMAANIRYFNGLPDFIAEGMAELTHGVDDDRADEILNLAGSPTALRSALSLSYGNYNSYAGGYMFLRYLAKQSVDNSGVGASENMAGYVASSNSAGRTNVTVQRGVNISGAVLTVANNFDGEAIDLSSYSSSVTKVNASATSGGVMIIGSTRANSITGGGGSDTVSGNLGNDTLSGGAGSDVIHGDAGNDKILGDAGNDTLSGGYGNDTLTGGAGSDVFIHMAGNDWITDYAAGQDKIRLVEEDIISASVSGSNVVLNTTNGAITVKGGKNKQLTVIDRNGVETASIYPINTLPGGISVSGAVLTASSEFTGEAIDLADYASAVTKVNAANLTRGVSLVGSAAANSLKGGSGNDTLAGGAGNDTLIGGAGSDVFLYESGNDVITDYAQGQDKIKLVSGGITGSSVSGSNVVLQIGSGKVTVKGGKNKQLTVIDASGKETTQIYGSAASGRSALWFTEDDTNFLGGENNLDAISAEKYSVTEIETGSGFEQLAQGDSLSAAVTFAKAK